MKEGNSKIAIAFSSCQLKEKLIDRLCDEYGRWLGGFRTLEIRNGDVRDGFDIQAIGGKRAVFASTRIVSTISFNKYNLNLAALEQLALPAVEAAISDGLILIIDELGPMPLKSSKFSLRIIEILFSSNSYLVFYRKGAKAFEDAFDKMDGALRFQLTQESWADILIFCRRWLSERIMNMEKKI